MATYIIGDLHLSTSTDKPMDIFAGWENHTELLKENWENQVKDEDTVIVAGDISWAMTLEEAIPDLEWINNLKGKKILMKGNHDYWWQSKKKLDDIIKEKNFTTISFLFNNAFETDELIVTGTRGWQIVGDTKSEEDKKIMNREAGRFKLSLDAAKKLSGYNLKKQIAVFHYPPIYNQFIFEGLFDLMLRENISSCYFGHLHGKIDASAAKTMKYNIECKLISADYLKFSPLKLT